MSNQSLNMFWPIDYLSMTHRLLIDSFDRFKLLANETIFKHSEEKKENFPTHRKIDVDMLLKVLHTGWLWPSHVSNF